MRIEARVFLASLMVGAVFIFNAACALAQNRIALKNGDSVELSLVYWVIQCRSIMIGLPEVEVLEGPQQVTLAVREEMVLPRRFNCVNKVPGGKVVMTAKGVTEALEGKLVYRLKYKTKDGDRQTSQSYLISLFP